MRDGPPAVKFKVGCNAGNIFGSADRGPFECMLVDKTISINTGVGNCNVYWEEGVEFSSNNCEK